MLHVYVHLVARGLPVAVFDEDDFLAGFSRQLPDAAFGGDERGFVGVTLGEFALSDCAAAERQKRRVQDALAVLGHDRVEVVVIETCRESWRDDLDIALQVVRSWVDALARHLVRR